ncbi:MAG: DinB family protein [Thermomicrobiales bacterium]|nr:DinB family protein [Thermomicrobiales bacterium]
MDNAVTGNPILANLLRFNQWANVELIDACAQLDDSLLDEELPGTQGTVRSTLWHLVELEYRYLGALRGTPNAAEYVLPGAPDGELATLRVLALDSGEQLVAWAEAASGDPMIDTTFQGQPYSVPASVFVGQTLNHAKEHRQQLHEALLGKGIAMPDLSAWVWWYTEQSVGLESATI